MTAKGFFILTDISGYTEYLTSSELEHANETLQALFDAQLKHIGFPLHISGFRGDAIFIYVPQTDFISPQSLLETLENQYIVFSETLQQMQLNTTCTCNACRNMKMLDLKMCIHYGEYLIQKLGDREELLGADVIVPHRMLKNHVIESTGVKAYALFSEGAAEQLGLDTLCGPLLAHSESYEHIGEVQMRVYDLRKVWQQYLDQKRVVVEPETAWIKIEVEIPFPPSLIWDYITTPALEASALGLEYVRREDNLGGRVRAGSAFHCAHKSGDFFNKVLDWKPFHYYTVIQSVGAGLEYYRTIRMEYDGKLTSLRIHLSRPDQDAPEGFRDSLEAAAREGYARLTSIMQADVESGKITTS
jgi:hypothetical protein